MVASGFDTVFLGIETPNPKALIKTKKQQNTSRSDENFLFNAVRKIQRKGIQVQGGFILGLDSDDETVFDAQIEFIQRAGIPVAPIYLLTALRGTDMYERLQSENRLLDAAIGTTAMTLNFKPELDPEVLLDGFRRVTATLYDATLENYFQRCLNLFEHLEPVPHLLKPMGRNAVVVATMRLRRELSKEQIPAFSRFIARVSPRFSPPAPPGRYAWPAWATTSKRSPDSRSRSTTSRCFWRLSWICFGRPLWTARSARRPSATVGRRSSRVPRGVTGRYPGDLRHDEDGVDFALESFRSSVSAQVERPSRFR